MAKNEILFFCIIFIFNFYYIYNYYLLYSNLISILMNKENKIK